MKITKLNPLIWLWQVNCAQTNHKKVQDARKETSVHKIITVAVYNLLFSRLTFSLQHNYNIPKNHLWCSWFFEFYSETHSQSKRAREKNDSVLPRFFLWLALFLSLVPNYRELPRAWNGLVQTGHFIYLYCENRCLSENISSSHFYFFQCDQTGLCVSQTHNNNSST